MTEKTLIYKGWIPTVTGRLSFSHFGECNRFSRYTRSINRADHQSRYLLVYQTRDTSDVLLPFKRWLAEPLLKIRGNLEFVCIAKTEDLPDDPQAKLVGRIFIIDYKMRWRRDVKNTIVACRDRLRSYTFNPETPSIKSFYESDHLNAQKICSQYCLFQASFVLERNGIVEFHVNEQMERAENAPILPTDPDEALHIRHILTAQLFYFLRDIGHRHRHHDASTDTIVDLYEVNEPRNEMTWRRSTLFSIYRRIIANKRLDDVETHFRSLGLLAYAKAFKHIWRETRSDKTNELPTFYDDALEESVRASELDMEAKANARTHAAGALRNWTISILSLFLSTAALLEIAPERFTDTFHPAPELIALGEVALRVPFQIMMACAALIYVLGNWHTPQASQGKKDLIKRLYSVYGQVIALGQAQPKYRIVAFFLVVGSLFLALAARMLLNFF